MGHYNYRVTGDPLVMPYAHEWQCAVCSGLPWQSQAGPEPAYGNPFLRESWAVADRNEKQFSRDHALKVHVSDFLDLARFFLGWPLVLTIGGAAYALVKNRTGRRVLLLASLFYLGVALDLRLFPHYAAPGTALAYVMAGMALRTARRAWPGTPAERQFLPWAIIAVFLLATGRGMLTPGNRYLFGARDYHALGKRDKVMQRLQNEPGEHLVLVRYGPHHELYEELVYNGADIDRSKVVWARSLGSEEDEELIRYYRSRKVWLVEEDGQARVSPYNVEPVSTITTR